MITTASAPGKIILFGEHAVVYGEPAIAAPVHQVTATAVVEDADHAGILLRAPDLSRDIWLADAPADHPLAAAVHTFLRAADDLPFPVPRSPFPGLTITITSTIPIASGLGSGAAITAALIRALAGHLYRPELATDAAVSRLTFEVERIHHGTPSGIDNTVVSYRRLVYFIRAGAPIKARTEQVLALFTPGRPLHLLIGDTGLHAPTRIPVGDVRRLWEADPGRMAPLFAACGEIAAAARTALEAGALEEVGRLMNANHACLQEMTVSSPELDRLVAAARSAGALGSKLSGGGRGGNMIALVRRDTAAAVSAALREAGAARVLETVVGDGD